MIEMNSNKILGWIFAVSLLIAFLHLGALEYFWYWQFWWFDIPLHFLGGVLLALIASFLYIKYGSTEGRVTNRMIFINLIATVLIVGFLWEVFELVAGGREFADSDYTLDTIADMFTDLAGGLFVYGIISNIYGRKS